MKNISAIAFAFTFVGAFLGAGYISGQETYQFFAAFGNMGIVGLVIAVTILGIFNIIITEIVKKTKIPSIDYTVVGANNKILLYLVGILEALVFFGTYVVMAAGAGALVQKLTGINSANIWGSFLFCLIISFIAIKGINGLINIFSMAVPILVVMTLFVGAVTVIHNYQNGFSFDVSDTYNPLIPNWIAGAITFASYNLFCAIGVLCPAGLRVKNKKSAISGTILGCILLVVVAMSVILSLAVLPEAKSEQLPMLAVAETLSPGFLYIYAGLLFIAMSGAALACIVPTVTYLAEQIRWAEIHGATVTFGISLLTFLLSCFGFSDLVGTVFSGFGYISLAGMAGLIIHYIKIKRQ